MSYTNEPKAYKNEQPEGYREDPAYTAANRRVVETNTVAPLAEYHDLVRWGPIFAGLVVAIATQLVLTGLGAAVGLTTLANTNTPQTSGGDIGMAVGIWSIISLLISLFLGGWIMARACGPMNRKTALLNGAILWATTLAISSWLVSTGVTGAFGLVAQGADAVLNQVPVENLPGGANPPQAPNVTPQQVQNAAGNAAKVGWSFALGSLLGLASALAGSAVGTRVPRHYDSSPR